MRRAVIVAGGEISDYSRARKYINDKDFLIFCDSGLRHAEGLHTSPDLIVGDFDSYTKPVKLNCECITLPCEKDDTDSFFAAKTAIKRGFDSLLLLGCTGGRLDHTLANVSVLCYAAEQNIPAEMVDDYAVYRLAFNKPVEINKSECSYFSVVPLDGKIERLTITGAKYPLENARVDMTYLYTVSNEVTQDYCTVNTHGDRALLMLDY